MSYIIFIFIMIIYSFISKTIKKQIKWQHYLGIYLFITYMIISLVEVVGFPSLSEWKRILQFNETIFNPSINIIPFKDGLGITDLLNIILFMPLGFFIPALWDSYKKLLSTLCYGIFFSLIIEVSQLFVLYRTTDINDLIMNGLGTFCGWIIFKIVNVRLHVLIKKIQMKISLDDSLIIKIEPYIYTILILGCIFFS